MKDMNADIAESYDVLVDNQGTIWVQVGGAWRYITINNNPQQKIALSWDAHGSLPTVYAPYDSLDKAATGFILSEALA